MQTSVANQFVPCNNSCMQIFEYLTIPVKHVKMFIYTCNILYIPPSVCTFDIPFFCYVMYLYHSVYMSHMYACVCIDCAVCGY